MGWGERRGGEMGREAGGGWKEGVGGGKEWGDRQACQPKWPKKGP